MKKKDGYRGNVDTMENVTNSNNSLMKDSSMNSNNSLFKDSKEGED